MRQPCRQCLPLCPAPYAPVQALALPGSLALDSFQLVGLAHALTEGLDPLAVVLDDGRLLIELRGEGDEPRRYPCKRDCRGGPPAAVTRHDPPVSEYGEGLQDAPRAGYSR